MGNLQTWGGPLTEHWHQHQMQLQKQILQRMRQFGMFPVAPAFAGHVPGQLKRVLPQARIDRLPVWAEFPPNYSQ